MLTDRNITQLIRLSAWDVVYSGIYPVALQRFAFKGKRPFYRLSSTMASEPANLSWNVGELGTT